MEFEASDLRNFLLEDTLHEEPHIRLLLAECPLLEPGCSVTAETVNTVLQRTED